MLKVARKLHVCVPEASFCWLKLSSGLCCCTCGYGWPGHVFSEDVLGGRFFFLIFPPVQPCAIIFVLATLFFFTSWGELYSCGHFIPSIREIKNRNVRTKILFPKDVTLFWWHKKKKKNQVHLWRNSLVKSLNVHWLPWQWWSNDWSLCENRITLSIQVLYFSLESKIHFPTVQQIVNY